MKITVDRSMNSDNDLVFVITVKDPAIASFTESEKKMMKILDNTEKQCQSIVLADNDDNNLEFQISSSIHDTKSSVFDRVMARLKFNINHDLLSKFNPMCQEIYNWVFDHQDGDLKKWMQEFDPQRTRYFFDNDRHMANRKDRQASEHDDDDDDDTEDEDE